MSFEVIIGPEFEDAVFRQVKPIMDRRLNEVRAVILEEFSAPKSGREYRRPSGGIYRASAAGEAPAIRSGRLRDSVSEPDVRRTAPGLVGKIEITAPYAGFLERGTPRISPRPFVKPAIEEIFRRRL
jgi:hypothetical protein